MKTITTMKPMTTAISACFCPVCPLRRDARQPRMRVGVTTCTPKTVKRHKAIGDPNGDGSGDDNENKKENHNQNDNEKDNDTVNDNDNENDHDHYNHNAKR